MFLGVETTFRHTFPSSDLICLPPDDPRVRCANAGIQSLATHSLEYIPMNELPVIGYPRLREELWIVRGQTLVIARRKCMAKSCFEVQENEF